mgnify:FL=1
MIEKQQNDLFNEPIKVINIGLTKFFESIESQSVEVIQIDWEPPAGGDPEMIEILDNLI